MSSSLIDKKKSSEELFRKAKHYGLDQNPKFIQLFRLYETLPEDTGLYDLVVEYLDSAKSDNVYQPDAYRATSPYEHSKVAGEIILGRTSRNLAFGLNIDELKRHMIIVGSSGSGKSSIMKLVAYQLLNMENDSK